MFPMPVFSAFDLLFDETVIHGKTRDFTYFYNLEDICDAIGIIDRRKAIKRIDEGLTETLWGESSLAPFATRAGVHQLLSTSRKPKAELLLKFIFGMNTTPLDSAWEAYTDSVDETLGRLVPLTPVEGLKLSKEHVAVMGYTGVEISFRLILCDSPLEKYLNSMGIYRVNPLAADMYATFNLYRATPQLNWIIESFAISSLCQ